MFGALFKNDSRTRKKTNLMVFLRPVVVRDGAATERLSLERYEQMLSGMKESQPAPSSTVPINDAPLLPSLAPRASTPAKN